MKKTTFFIFFLFYQIAFCQCPDKHSIWTKINDVTILDNDKIIRELTTLQQSCIKCQYNNDSTYAKLLHVLGRTYWYIGNLDKAILLTNEAIQLNSNKKNTSKEANLIHSYFNLGQIYLQKNDYKLAIQNFENGIFVGNKYVEKQTSVSKSYEKLANIYFFTGDYQQCIEKADMGIKIAKSAKSNTLRIYNTIQKIQAQVAMRQIKEANDNIVDVLKLAKNEPDKFQEAFIFTTFGEIKKNTKEYKEAIDLYSKALANYKNVTSKGEKGDAYGCSQALTNIGYIYRLQNDYKNALKYYNYALTYANEAPIKSRIFDNIGAVYHKKIEFEKALQYYQKALLVASTNFKDADYSHNPAGQSMKLSSAKEYLYSLLQDKATCWLDYYKATKNKNYLKYALQTYEVADKMIDFMRFEHTGTQSKYFWRDKTRAVYEAAIETCFLLNDSPKAFYFFEKSRAVLLNDKLNELGANQKLSEADRQQELDLQRQILALNETIEKSKTTQEKDKTKEKLLDLQEKQERFIKSLETKNPTYYRFKYDTTSYDLRKVQAYLNATAKDKQTLVEYFVGDSATYAIVVSPSSMTLKKLDFKKQTAELFLNFCSKTLATKTDLNDFLVASNNLYQSLIAPLNLPKGRLIISQDGVFFPFEAISQSATKAQYLLNDYAISYTYSAQFLLKSQANQNLHFTNKFIGFAPVNYAKYLNVSNLAGADQSLDHIASHFNFAKKLTQQDANRKNFIAQAANYSIIQLLTHADADSADKEPVIFFGDSVLKVSELNGFDKLKTQLLVLSACKTGVGKMVKGEGVLSFARGFATLGIPATITTLWSVENQATYSLTELFYNYLVAGKTKDIALQQAKLEFLRTHALDKQDPTFWAATVLIGDSAVISDSNAYYYFGGGFVVALILILLWRKLALKKITQIPFSNHS